MHFTSNNLSCTAKEKQGSNVKKSRSDLFTGTLYIYCMYLYRIASHRIAVCLNEHIDLEVLSSRKTNLGIFPRNIGLQTWANFWIAIKFMFNSETYLIRLGQLVILFSDFCNSCPDLIRRLVVFTFSLILSSFNQIK